MNITLRQLQAFAHVQRCGSFVQAAQAMFVTQAALSHLLRDLESNLGFRLFHRTTRSVRLTAEGEVFLPHAARILANLEGAADCAAALAQGRRGILRLSTTEVLASTHVTPVVAAFQEANPDIEVLLNEALPDAVIADLEAERVEIALGPERRMPESIAAETLFTTRLVALCARSHPLAGRASLAWGELAGHPLLLAKGGGRVSIASDINNAALLESAREIGHFTTLLAQAALGRHVAVANAYVAPFLPVYGLKAIPLTRPAVRRRVMLYVSRRFGLSQVAGSFIALLKSRLGPAARAAV